LLKGQFPKIILTRTTERYEMCQEFYCSKLLFRFMNHIHIGGNSFSIACKIRENSHSEAALLAVKYDKNIHVREACRRCVLILFAMVSIKVDLFVWME